MMQFSLEPSVHRAGAAFDACVRAVETGSPFVYAKLNHGFWERLVRITRTAGPVEELDDVRGRQIEKDLGFGGTAFIETGFLKEMVGLLGELPSPASGFHFSAGIDAWPGSQEIEGTPFVNRFACLAEIEKYVSRVHLDDAAALKMTGYEFKEALIAGQFQDFARPLAEQPFLLICNPAMTGFIDFVGAREADHLQIDARKARFDRRAILEDALRRLDRLRLRRVVMQAGGALSTWLCHHLFVARPDIQIFDIGNAMAVSSPEVMQRQNWARVYARSIYHGARKVHPGWLDPRGGEGLPSTAGGRPVTHDILRDGALVDLAGEHGVKVPELGEAVSVPVAFPEAPIAFIENKAPDFRRIEQFLQLSLAANHHANGGPVSRLLEAAVARLLNLPEGRKVVACSSATAAIFLATSLAAYKAGRNSLRWVASAYDFFTSNIGPLAGTRLIDSQENGRFSLENLRRLPSDSWDGVLFTNLFAQHADWSEIREFCRAQGKHFVVDNAVGLFDRPADSHAGGDIEAISCHHTKPWGMGEGGLLILDEADEATIRGLMNFGAILPPEAHIHATNAKVSDLACAAILDRLERMPYWSLLYRMQERRVVSVIDDYDIPLTLLAGGTKPLSPRAHVPLVAERATDLARLANTEVVLRKYYRPLLPTPLEGQARGSSNTAFPNAEALYDRIVCCPCNPELRLLSSERLAVALQQAAS